MCTLTLQTSDLSSGEIICPRWHPPISTLARLYLQRIIEMSYETVNRLFYMSCFTLPSRTVSYHCRNLNWSDMTFLHKAKMITVLTGPCLRCLTDQTAVEQNKYHWLSGCFHVWKYVIITTQFLLSDFYLSKGSLECHVIDAFNVWLPSVLSYLQTCESSAWTVQLLNMQKYFYIFQNSRKMGTFQDSSRGLIWKQQIRGPTVVWGRAMPHGEATGGLKKRKKPKRKPWAGAAESVRSTRRLTGVMKWMRTSPGAPESTLLLAKPRSLTSPFTTHLITTSQEKTSCPKRASGASTRKRRAAWRMIAMIIYFSLSRGKKSLSCESASDLASQCLSGFHVYNILAIFFIICD